MASLSLFLCGKAVIEQWRCQLVTGAYKICVLRESESRTALSVYSYHQVLTNTKLAKTRHLRGGAVVQKHFWFLHSNDVIWIFCCFYEMILRDTNSKLVCVHSAVSRAYTPEMFDRSFFRLLCLFLHLIISRPFPGRCSLFFYLATLTSWRQTHNKWFKDLSNLPYCSSVLKVLRGGFITF